MDGGETTRVQGNNRCPKTARKKIAVIQTRMISVGGSEKENAWA
jgi:hypothetical protein